MNSVTYPGFTLSLYEYEATIPTLWNAVGGKREIPPVETGFPLLQLRDVETFLSTFTLIRVHRSKPGTGISGQCHGFYLR